MSPGFTGCALDPLLGTGTHTLQPAHRVTYWVVAALGAQAKPVQECAPWC